jgi:outer membrane biogenesis lipoprotein LolB
MFRNTITCKVLIVFFLVFLISACDLHSPSAPSIPPEQFQHTGLEGLKVNSFETDGDLLYAATDDGVWSASISDDLPEWQDEGLQSINVIDIVIFPDGSRLAAVEREQVQSDLPTIFRIDTFSEEWEPFQQDYGGQQEYNWIEALRRHPDQPDVLFARGSYHVARSTNSGDNWQVVFENWDAMGYQADLLEIDPHNTDRIWIGGENAALQPYLFYSSDLGQSWQDLEIETGGDDAVYSMAFHPDDEGRLLLGMEGKILKSENRGEDWAGSFENDLYHYILTMTSPDGRLSETIYASGTERGAQRGNLFFLVTEDFGENWEKISSEQQLNDIAVNDMIVRQTGNESTVYLATSRGVWIYRY